MPQFNFQPIYSKYAGNTLDLEDKLLSKKEEEYRVGEHYMDTYDKIRKSMQAAPLSPDVEAVNILSKNAIEDIKSFADKGDYENFYNKIKNSVLDLQSKYAPYAQNMKSYHEQVKEIMDTKDWTPYEKQLFLAKKKKQYEDDGGLKVDPITGQATGYINMGKMADYHNVQKELMEFASKISVNETFENNFIKASKNPDGTYELYDKTTGHREKNRSLEDVKRIGKSYLLNSPELLGTLRQKADLDAFSIVNNTENPQELLINVNKKIDEKIKYIKAQSDKGLSKEMLVEKQKYIDDLKNSKVDINGNPEQIIQQLKLNEAIGNDVYNVADALKRHDVENTLDMSHGIAWKLHEDKVIKSVAATKDLMINADNRDITSEEFSKNYNNINTEVSNLETTFNNNSKKIFNSKVPIENRDRILYDLRKLGITDGFSKKDFENIQAIFKANKVNISVEDIEKNINTILMLTEQKKSLDKNNSELTKLNNAIIRNIDIATINKFKNTEPSITFDEAKEILKDALINSDSPSKITRNVYSSEKRMKKLAGEYNENLKKGKGNLQSWDMVRSRNIQENSALMYISARKFLKNNNIKVDPKTLQLQRYGFTNPEENSLTKDFNDKLINGLNSGGLSNFNSNNKSVEALFNNGEIKDTKGNNDTPNSIKATNAMPLTDNQVLVTFESGEGNDKRIFKVPIDVKSDGSNLKSLYREYHLESAKNMPYGKKLKSAESESYFEAQKGHVLAVANVDIEDSDKINIENLPINSSDIISANNYRFKITRTANGYSAKILNRDGKEEFLPVAKDETHKNVLLYPSYDDLIFAIGKVLVGYSN